MRPSSAWTMLLAHAAGGAKFAVAFLAGSMSIRPSSPHHAVAVAVSTDPSTRKPFAACLHAMQRHPHQSPMRSSPDADGACVSPEQSPQWAGMPPEAVLITGVCVCLHSVAAGCRVYSFAAS